MFLIISLAGAAFAADPPPDPSLAPVEDVLGLPRVLLIGDSISMGYTIPTRELLAGKANVHRVPENGGPTSHGAERMDAWLEKLSTLYRAHITVVKLRREEE